MSAVVRLHRLNALGAVRTATPRVDALARLTFVLDAERTETHDARIMNLKGSTRSLSLISWSNCEPVSHWDRLVVDRRWSMERLGRDRLV